MGRAVAFYDFDRDPAQALDEMTDNEVAAATLHELGEGAAGENLGTGWAEMMLGVAGSLVEVMARAVRDLLADCLVTLPALIESRAEASLHFFFANMRGMRQEFAPGLWSGYQHWVEQGDLSALTQATETGQRHWRRVASTLLALHQDSRPSGLESMQSFLRAQHLP